MIDFIAILIVLLAGRAESPQRVFLLSFFLGLLSDLIAGRYLGTGAAAYLLMALAVFLLRLRFQFSLRLGLLVIFVTQTAWYLLWPKLI
jgi:cell shape-determining protein MreD